MTASAAVVLVVEFADAEHAELVPLLSANGYAVVRAAGVAQAQRALVAWSPDLVVTEVGAEPARGGHKIAAHARALGCGVIFVTTADALNDRLAGFAAGADDYVTKPFRDEELLARVCAVLRRCSAGRTLRVGALEIDTRARVVRVAGHPVALSPREFDVLETLAFDPGAVVSRADILAALDSRAESEGIVDVYISGLRAKLRLAGIDPVKTARGAGFRLA